jgi:hypothetical protein
MSDRGHQHGSSCAPVTLVFQRISPREAVFECLAIPVVRRSLSTVVAVFLIADPCWRVGRYALLQSAVINERFF